MKKLISLKATVGRSGSVAVCFALMTAAAISLSASRAWTKVEYDSNQLMMKNADQITELVRKKIKKAQDIQSKQENSADGKFLPETEAVEQLKDALRIVLARPDQDGTRGNAFARLRRELIDLNSLDKALTDLSNEAINAVKESETPSRRAATYMQMLESLMAELKPEAKTNKAFGNIIVSIRDANLTVPEKVRSEALLRSMAKPVSPSETAAKILPKNGEK